MNTIQKINHWTESHSFVWMDMLRFFLGLMLFYKAIEFGRNPKDVFIMVHETPFDVVAFMMVHYIVMAHLFGGLLIMLGLITRISILFQLPILIGAVLFVRTNDLFSFYGTPLLAWFVLAMLIVFLIYGSGKLSADNYMKRHPNG